VLGVGLIVLMSLLGRSGVVRHLVSVGEETRCPEGSDFVILTRPGS
jgi:hypothetical protein